MSKYNGDVSSTRGKKEQSHCTLTVVKILDNGPKRDAGNESEVEPVACESPDTNTHTKSFDSNTSHYGKSSSISHLQPPKSSIPTNSKIKVPSNKQLCTSSTGITSTTKRSSTSPDPTVSTTKKQRTTMNSLSNAIVEPKKPLPPKAITPATNNVAEAIIVSSKETIAKNESVSKSNSNNKISTSTSSVKQQKVNSTTIADDTLTTINNKTKLSNQMKTDMTDMPITKTEVVQDEGKSIIKEASTIKKTTSLKPSLLQQPTDKPQSQRVTTKVKHVSSTDISQPEIKKEVLLSPKSLLTPTESIDSIKKDEKKKETSTSLKKTLSTNALVSNKKQTTVTKELDVENVSTKSGSTPIVKATSVPNVIQSNEEKEKKTIVKPMINNKPNSTKNNATINSLLLTNVEPSEIAVKQETDNTDILNTQPNIAQLPSTTNTTKTQVKPLSTFSMTLVKTESPSSRADVETKNESLSSTNSSLTVIKSQSSPIKNGNVSPGQSNQNNSLKKFPLNSNKSDQQNSSKLEQSGPKLISNLGKIPRKQPPQQSKKGYNSSPRHRSPSFDSDKEYRRSNNKDRSNSRSTSYNNRRSSSKGRNGNNNYRSSPNRSRRYNDRERSRSRTRYYRSSSRRSPSNERSRRSFNDHRRNSKSDSYRSNNYQRVDDSRQHYDRRTKSKSPYRHQHQEDIRIKEDSQSKMESTSSPLLLSISPFSHSVTPEGQQPPRSVEQTYLTSPEQQHHIFQSEDDNKVVEMDIDDDNISDSENNNPINHKTVSCTFIKAETAPPPLKNDHLHYSDDGGIDSDEQHDDEEFDDEDDSFPVVLTDESLRTKIAFIYNLFSHDVNRDAILEKFVHFFKKSGLVDTTNDDHDTFTYDLLKLTPGLINQLADDLGYVKQ
ncbi:unnamed protein product [Didymodactylos carnosus]|uniref:Uncharacterized protein n=1 Tax=Didymodactylos carnosus TaxID=1234261 RepID=A0A8S2KMV0_9BILA|nr:unnamed protein product [Didymodactylos carnosus]CAF3858274.1 unnamed protein product [Didymodactylos carnosus]